MNLIEIEQSQQKENNIILMMNLKEENIKLNNKIDALENIIDCKDKLIIKQIYEIESYENKTKKLYFKNKLFTIIIMILILVVLVICFQKQQKILTQIMTHIMLMTQELTQKI